MRFNWLQLLALMLFALAGNLSTYAQGYSFNCARDTVLPGCPATACFTIKTIIPDPQRQSTTYAVNSPVVNPSCLLASNNPAIPGTNTNLNIDDRYSGVLNLGFPFVFFGNVRNSVVASSNGYLTFDLTEANQFSHWSIINGGTPQNLPSTFYDRELIMGPYHDIDVGITTSPNRLISTTASGISPYRKWSLNYYKIPLFSGACNSLIENTHSITLYESTGIIDVTIYDKQICMGWNQGRAMVGVQNFNQNIGVMVPGRRATDPPWGFVGMSEKYRFVPIGGTPLFRRVELYDLSNNLIATGTTVQLPNGDREATFSNVCPPAGAATQYVIKGFYDKIDDVTVEIFGTDTITVNRTAALAATTATTSATCGFSNGTITVNNVSGGTPAYEFSLDGITWQSSNVFTGVAAGTHTVYIRDAGNVCSATYQATVGVVSNLTATTASSATACSGVNNGSITITPTIGFAPFNYVIDGGAPVSGGSPYTFTGLTPGNHTISFTDANGCTSNSITVNVATGTGVTATTSFTPTSCAGATNGTITVNTTAGTAPFTYQLGANPPQASNVFTGLAAGTYTILVTDFVGCTRSLTRTVSAGSSVTATRTLTATSCPTAANGSVTITPTSGTGPYEFSLDGGAFVAGAVPFTFSGLTAGAHNFVVRDVPTACLSLTINFTILSGPGINASAVPAATSCSGAANGSVTVTPTSGTGPYSYVLDGGAPVVDPSPYTFSNLTAGPHTVVVTDNSTGCASGTINFNVAVGPILTASAVPAATSCSGATNGSITVTATSGTGPYTFSLDGGASVAGASPYLFNNLAAGNHTITVTDVPTGCVTNVIPVSIDAGPVITTTASKTDVLCNGGNTGTITVAQPAVGSAPFEYSLDGTNWQTSNLFNGLAAGTYTVYYRELNGCQNSLSITVTEPPTLGLLATTNPVVCNGQSNGIITAAVTGGATPYEYSIDGGANWQTSNVFNVPAGLYTVTIRDGNGCTTTQNINVTEPPVLSAVSTNTNASCNGGNDGVITVSATGGNTSYEYSIDGGANWQSSNVFNVAPGNYTITVRDNLGCTTNFPTTVGLTNDLTFTQQTDPVICESKSTQLNLVSNATQYAWTPSTGLSSTTINNPVANPVVTTQYIVTATLGRCSANDTVVVNVNPAPIPNAGPDGFICYGQDYQLNASGGVQYKWTPSTYLDNPDIASPLSTPTKDITYTVTILADANGCASLVTDQITIDVTPPIKIKTYPFDTVVYEMDQFQMLAVPSDPDVVNFNWTPSTGLDNPAIANPMVTAGSLGGYIQGTTSNEILYQVIGSTVAGCIGEGYVKVRVYKGPDLYVPTGFTPNGDGRNDRFVPFPVGIKSLTYFRVYNRWGQMVYSTNRLHEGWDGVFSGLAQPSGSYVWMAEAITEQGKTITKKGAVTLIR